MVSRLHALAGLIALCLALRLPSSATVAVTAGAARPYAPIPAQMGPALTGAFQSAYGANLPSPRTDPILSSIAQMDLTVPENVTALEPFHAQLAALDVDEKILAKAEPDELRQLFSLAADEAETDVVDRAFRAVGAVTPGLSSAMDKDAFDAFEKASLELTRIERENTVFLARSADQNNSALKMVRLYGRLARERIAAIRATQVGESMEKAADILAGPDITVAAVEKLNFDGDLPELQKKLSLAKNYFSSDRKQRPPNTIKQLTGPLHGIWEFKMDGSNDRLFFRYLEDTRQIVLLHHISRGNWKTNTDDTLKAFTDDTHTRLSIAPELPDELKPMQKITPADLKIRLTPKTLAY